MSTIYQIVNVEGAIVRNGYYLLVIRGSGENHAAGMLSLVGGKVEGKGNIANILEDTLRREIQEEIGVEISDTIYVHSNAFMISEDKPVVNVVFLCRLDQGEPSIHDSHEVAEIRWLTANEILTNPDTPDWTRDSIRRAEKMRNMLGW
ncbi:MAG: NUDIX domain-containing protein [Anaerolineaceae bacterium]|nr:NUDIX domain-containing protein [Anaerolineaceae bacterium]